LGLPAFHHILTDKRVQNLPLILETPSFEKPEVWATELEVLNRLSNLVVVESTSDSDGMVNVIKETVKKAGGSTSAKGRSMAGRVKRGK
jgi:AP endonuclease-1